MHFSYFANKGGGMHSQIAYGVLVIKNSIEMQFLFAAQLKHITHTALNTSDKEVSRFMEKLLARFS